MTIGAAKENKNTDKQNKLMTIGAAADGAQRHGGRRGVRVRALANDNSNNDNSNSNDNSPSHRRDTLKGVLITVGYFLLSCVTSDSRGRPHPSRLRDIHQDRAVPHIQRTC